MSEIHILKKGGEVLYPQTHISAVVDDNGNTVEELIDNKLDSNDIVNDLTTGGADKALSAEQGKVLDKEASKKVFTDNGYINKAVKELYIIDPDRTEEDVYTLKYLRRKYKYNNQWTLYIHKNRTTFISGGSGTSPENDIVFKNTDPTYKFFAVIDWQQLEFGVESITQDTTITKDAFYIGNCPMIASVTLENNLNTLNQKVDANDENIKENINNIKEEINPLLEIGTKQIYDSICKDKYISGFLGKGVSKTILDNKDVKITKKAGVGNDTATWTGFYVNLDESKQFITGHEYFIGVDITAISNSVDTTIKGYVRIFNRTSVVGDATGKDNIVNVGERKLLKFSLNYTSEDTEAYRILVQNGKFATNDAYEILLHNMIVVDLTEYGLSYDNMVSLVNNYPNRLFLTSVETALRSEYATKAETAENLPDTYRVARYTGKTGVLMGDSHTTRRADWIAKVFERMGAAWDSVTNTYIVGKSTNKVMDGYEDTCTPLMSQAKRLIEKVNEGNTIDIIFIENVHYNFNNYTFDTAAPFKPTQIIQLGDYNTNVSEEQTWFNENIDNLLQGKTQKVGTMLKYTFRANCMKLTFSGTPKAGTFSIKVRGKNYPTTLTGTESLEEAVGLIFVNFNDLAYDTVTLDGNTITITPNDGVYQHIITIDAGTTGLTVSQAQEAGSPTTVYRYFDSRDIADWNTSSHWYRLDYWNYGFGYIKGVIETLLEAIPNVEIIMLGLANTSPQSGQFVDDLGIDIVKFQNQRNSTRISQDRFLSVGKSYNLKTIDVDGLSGITSANWFEFYSPGNVHPKVSGYKRWADTIIRELGV